jgi:hypothetical protein
MHDLSAVNLDGEVRRRLAQSFNLNRCIRAREDDAPCRVADDMKNSRPF